MLINKNQASVSIGASDLRELRKHRNIGENEIVEIRVAVDREAHIITSRPQWTGSTIRTGLRVEFAVAVVSKRRPIGRTMVNPHGSVIRKQQSFPHVNLCRISKGPRSTFEKWWDGRRTGY